MLYLSILHRCRLMTEYIIDYTENAFPSACIDTHHPVHDEDDNSKDESSHGYHYGTALKFFKGRPRCFIH